MACKAAYANHLITHGNVLSPGSVNVDSFYWKCQTCTLKRHKNPFRHNKNPKVLSKYKCVRKRTVKR